jgi:hypothetical protein|nr:MAG TPA: hypothetical protein [Caudoviricetes sp.]
MAECFAILYDNGKEIMDMKKKVNLLIKGNLLVINNITGGGIFSTSLEQLEEHFNVSEAAIIEGDLNVESFDCRSLCVVVLGAVVAKGGNYVS